MRPVLLLCAAGLLSWLLRVGFIAVLPAERMPASFRRALRHLAPAVMSALVVAALAEGSVHQLINPSARHAALLAAALVAYRYRNVALPIAASLAVIYFLG